MRPSDDKSIKVQRALNAAHNVADRPTGRGLDLASRVEKAEASFVEAVKAKALDPQNTMLAESLANRQADLDAARAAQNTYRDRENRLNESRIRGAITRSTTDSAVRADIAGFRNMPDVVGEGMRLNSRRSYDPYRTRAGAMQRISQAHDEFEYIDPDEDEVSKRQQRREISGRIKKLTRIAAVADVAIQERRREGSDVPSLLRGAQRIGENEASRQSAGARAADVAAGRYGTMTAMQKSQSGLAQDIEANKKLLMSMDEAAKGYDDLAKTLHSQQKAYRENEKVLKEMARQGGGGGGFGGALKTAQPYIQMGLGAATALNSALTQGVMYDIDRRVSQPLERIGLGNRFASLTNEAYDITKRAKSGDIHALMQAAVLSKPSDLAGNQGKVMRELQGELKEATRRGDALGTTTNAAGAFFSGTLASGGNMYVGGANAATQIGAGVYAGAAKQKMMGQRIGLQLDQKATEAAYEEQRREFAKQVTEIDARQVTNAINYRVSTASGYRGPGLVAGDKPLRAQRAADLELSQLGLDGDEQARLAQMLQRSMGAKAVGSSVGIQRRGGQLAQSGIIESAGQYAGWAGAMAGVGGGQRDVEAAMTRAVKTGLESAKTIEQMVMGIVSLSERDSRYGVNTSTGAGAMLERGVGGMLSKGFDVNTAVQGAKSGVDLLNEMGGGNRLNMGSVYGMKNYLRQGATMMQATTMNMMTPQMMSEIVEGGRSKNLETRANARRLAEAQGLGSYFFNKDGGLNEQRATQAYGIKMGSIAAPLMAIAPDSWREIDSAIKAGRPMSSVSAKAQQDLRGQLMMQTNNSQAISGAAAFFGEGGNKPNNIEDRIKRNSEFKLANQVGAAKASADAAERKIVEDRGNFVPNMMGVVRDNSRRPGSQDLGKITSADATNAANNLTLNTQQMSSAMSGFASQLNTTAGRFELLVAKIDRVLDKKTTGETIASNAAKPVQAVGGAVASAAKAVGRAISNPATQEALLDAKMGIGH